MTSPPFQPKESLPARVAEPTDLDDKFIPPNCVREQQLKETEMEHYITEDKNRVCGRGKKPNL